MARGVSNDGGLLLLLLLGMLLFRCSPLVQVRTNRRADREENASVVLNSHRVLVLLLALQTLGVVVFQCVLTNTCNLLPLGILLLVWVCVKTTTALGPSHSRATSGRFLWSCARGWRGG